MVKKLPFNYNAITVPPFGIFSTSNEVALIEHERVHWQQYQRMGLLPYYINYAIGSAQGYDANPMEMEARANETDYCRANYTACVRSGQAKTIANPRFRL